MFFASEQYRRMCCSECGVTYYFPEDWATRAKQEGKSWKCPNGHSQWYGEGENDKLRRERDQLKQRIAQKEDHIAHLRDSRDHTERRLHATKGVVTRIKNRVGRGVCPCCNRTFENLHRHMAGQHPNYIAEAAE